MEENIFNITNYKKNLQWTSKVAHTLPAPPSQNISNMVDSTPSPPIPPPLFTDDILLFSANENVNSSVKDLNRDLARISNWIF